MVSIYRARIGRPLQDDVATLVAVRCEWRRRHAARATVAPIAALPIAA